MLQTLSHSLVALPPPPPSRQLVVAIAIAVAVAVAVAVTAPALSLPLLLDWLDTRRIRGSLHARGGLYLGTVALVATATTIPATKINTMIGQYDETDRQERASLVRCSELLNDFHVLSTLNWHMKTSKKNMILFER
ncbi:hypothetical protein R3P38DRAFT_2990888 [Favolaschia claudopus]|uniref:Uncharacterized protein n=1 Tax=Favolaschia claudopus TaxID=2862362 RepID=A0AAW0AU65_9AGAR